MQKLFVFIGAGLLLTACHQIKRTDDATGTAGTNHEEYLQQVAAGASGSDSSSYTTIEWLENDQDLGKIAEGQKIDVSFRFRNTGKKPLVIYSVNPACGCTAAEPPKEPIAPGAEGVISATFDSNGRPGTNNKTMMVMTNTFGTTAHELRFRVDVTKKETGTNP